jgi:microcystin-dependent protein
MKFTKIFSVVFFTLLSFSIFSQIGINTQVPDASAALHIVSKPAGQGLLMPKLFQFRRTLINPPALGLMAYDLSSNIFYYNRLGTMAGWFAVNPWLTQGDSITPNVMYTHSVVTNVGIGVNTPTARLDVNGSIKSNSVVTSPSLVATSMVTTPSLTVGTFPPNPLVPAGVIVMWSNYLGNPIPNGWAICDGNNNTPDLRGRFIVSSGTNTVPLVPGDVNQAYTVGQIGGENKHILTSAESGVPAHSHGTAPHTHRQKVSNSDGFGTQIEGNNTKSGSDRGWYVDFSSSYGGDHYTDPSTVTVNNNTTQNASVSHENRPQFYVLAYIMKLP